jgi:hypothetical protein
MLSQYLIQRQQQKLGLAVKEEKKQKPISIKSVKRIAEDKLYKKIVKEMLALKPNCRIKSPVCTGKAQGLDHLQKRSPKNYLKRSNLIPACNACQLYKEEHPEWSNKNGTSISRFKKINHVD